MDVEGDHSLQLSSCRKQRRDRSSRARAVRECGLRGVAIYNDLDSNSMHLNFADEKVRLPGEDLASTYLSIEAILDAARASGAEAIHRGMAFSPKGLNSPIE